MQDGRELDGLRIVNPFRSPPANVREKVTSYQDPDVVERALGHFRKRPSLGFSDCLVLESARKAGHGPLGTFDRELGRIEGAKRLGGR